ncbi:ABC-2 type transport system permease protein [Amycolatopsis xylanica]|uniref:ABC-2 type transport system permease protein n=1 Tax=Amycolatopsis xylanica TaxID=589385 RepID=A0A1H2SWR7_9PSEU|nr:ABC transporter permease subunit [Amycolatopsis xylanica]SDW35915.1 ABC-2 type transport system permease protein [Amycolatopsis xylanica]
MIVAGQELRDLWLSGRAPTLLFGFSLLVSAITYFTAIDQTLNFLEQREAVTFTLQIAVGVGVLMTLVVSADALSGERERGTLESLLLTPVSRRAIVAGKFVAALSVWFGAYLVTIPYIWVLGHGISVVRAALTRGLLVGTLVAVALSLLALLISAKTNSNKASLAISLFLLLALFAPTQLPGGTPKGWFFDVLLRANPVASGLHYLTTGAARDLNYLISPVAVIVLAGGWLLVRGPRLVRLFA